METMKRLGHAAADALALLLVLVGVSAIVAAGRVAQRGSGRSG